MALLQLADVLNEILPLLKYGTIHKDKANDSNPENPSRNKKSN